MATRAQRSAVYRAGMKMSNALYNWAQSATRLPDVRDRKMADEMVREWDAVTDFLELVQKRSGSAPTGKDKDRG